MEVKDQLARLVRIQELVLDVQRSQALVEDAPAKVEGIEARFRERNAEYVALKERYDALEADRKSRSLELQTLEDDRKKFQDALMQVQNQREYAAVLKEIDIVKARISEHEEAILRAMEEIEKLKGDLDVFTEHIEKERGAVGLEVAEVEAAVDAAKKSIEACEAERASLETDLPQPLVAAVRRVEEGRRGLFLAKVSKDAMCTACHVRVRPQVYQEIRQAHRIHTCGSCKRFLYVENSVETRSNGTTAAPVPGAGVRAMDGGAV
jgi:predicted  nucleic acid-binding Zn-ribbon protein